MGSKQNDSDNIFSKVKSPQKHEKPKDYTTIEEDSLKLYSSKKKLQDY